VSETRYMIPLKQDYLVSMDRKHGLTYMFLVPELRVIGIRDQLPTTNLDQYSMIKRPNIIRMQFTRP
jgi:hypothetical protein